jgi:hypothetical protein
MDFKIEENFWWLKKIMMHLKAKTTYSDSVRSVLNVFKILGFKYKKWNHGLWALLHRNDVVKNEAFKQTWTT